MKDFSKTKYSKTNNGVYKKSSKQQNKNSKSNTKREFNKEKNITYDENNLKRSRDLKNNATNYSNPKYNQKNNKQNKNLYKTKNNIVGHNLKRNNVFSNEKTLDDWIWGKHSVLAALKSERPINRIWCTSEISSSEKFFLLLNNIKSKGVLIEEVSWSRLSQLTFGAVHQGIALQLACSKTVSLPDLINLSKRKSTNPIIVALDGITDPHNLGAIIRSAEALGCNGVIIPQRRSAGLTGTVAKVAAGALEHIPLCRVVNLNRALDELKKNNYLAIGLSGEGQLSISKYTEKSPLVVIIGSEGKGISLLTQKKCDFLLKIPLKGKTSSLNASVAAGISLCYLTNI